VCVRRINVNDESQCELSRSTSNKEKEQNETTNTRTSQSVRRFVIASTIGSILLLHVAIVVAVLIKSIKTLVAYTRYDALDDCCSCQLFTCD
jgi:uncharacterized membrane protein